MKNKIGEKPNREMINKSLSAEKSNWVNLNSYFPTRLKKIGISNKKLHFF